MPAVSILIPARNAAATLDEALQSIASQTFTNWQAVVVDDASTDETPAILERWSRSDPRFWSYRNETARGIAASLNQALFMVGKAGLVARIDADDVALPERLERQMERMSAGDVVAVGCQVHYFPEELVRDGARRYETWLNSLTTPAEHDRDLFVECPLAHPTLMARTEAVWSAGRYRNAGWPEDYDLLLRLWERGGRFAKVPETLLLWREGPDRASRTHADYSPEAFLRCKAHFLHRTHLTAARKALIFGSGPVGKALARALLAEGVEVAGFVDVDPRRVGQRIYGRPVFSRTEGLGMRGAVFGLAAVGQPGAREELRKLLRESGWVEGEDFRCAA